jgi:hypothetical protein
VIRDCHGGLSQGVQFLMPGAALVCGTNRGVTRVPATFILPDLPWAVLLETIVRDARPGDRIVVYTDPMRQHVEQVVRAAGRDDLEIRQVEPPAVMQVA